MDEISPEDLNIVAVIASQTVPGYMQDDARSEGYLALLEAKRKGVSKRIVVKRRIIDFYRRETKNRSDNPPRFIDIDLAKEIADTRPPAIEFSEEPSRADEAIAATAAVAAAGVAAATETKSAPDAARERMNTPRQGTPRYQQAVALKKKGLSRKQIAATMGISIRTVGSHLRYPPARNDNPGPKVTIPRIVMFPSGGQIEIYSRVNVLAFSQREQRFINSLQSLIDTFERGKDNENETQ